MVRKKKLRLIQFSLFLSSVVRLFFAYSNLFISKEETIISKQVQKKLEEQVYNQGEKGDVFYNISYSGFDFSGNRYVLNAKEAINDKDLTDNIFLKKIDATFFMKNGTILKVFSEEGIYNNKTLDMIFENDVKAFYGERELFAERAEFSNSKSFLTISKKVKVKDNKGTLFADKLLFDIENQNLDIVAFDKNKVNANISLK